MADRRQSPRRECDKRGTQFYVTLYVIVVLVAAVILAGLLIAGSAHAQTLTAAEPHRVAEWNGKYGPTWYAGGYAWSVVTPRDGLTEELCKGYIGDDQVWSIYCEDVFTSPVPAELR